MNSFEYRATSLGDTDLLGAALGELLPAGTTVALCGTLGAGKTRLVQAIAASCGVGPGQVVSPTFVLCQEYHGSRNIFHLDAYRLRDDDEFLQLGPEEYFDSDGLILIEWADRVEKCLPRSRLRIEIDAVSESDRVFRITGVGNPAWNEVIESIQQRLGVYGS